jgi:uncharacterized damage-inducible protein DinB
VSEPAPRRRPVYLTDERELFEAWLDFHRATLLAKCDGLTPAQLRMRPVASSQLSLHGLIRHLAEAERNWIGRILTGELDRPDIWPAVTTGGDSTVLPADADWADDLATWQAECVASRATTAAYPLDHTGRWRDKDVSLRSVYHHTIQEYARHNGHADLIRELIDGSTGL